MKKKYLIFGIIALILPVILTARAATVLFPSGGGLGTSTAPSSGQVPIGTSGGIYGPGTLTTTNVTEGTNLYFTNARLYAPGFITPTSTAFNWRSTTTIAGISGDVLLATSSAYTGSFNFSTSSQTITLNIPKRLLDINGLATTTNNYLVANGTTWTSVSASTTNIAEGANLYFTNARLYAPGFITGTSTAFATTSTIYAPGFITATSSAFTWRSTTTVAGISGDILLATSSAYTGSFNFSTSSQTITLNIPKRILDINGLATTTNTYIMANGTTWTAVTPSTTNITEGTNLYFTTARLYSAGFITATSTGQYTTTTINGLSGALTFATSSSYANFAITISTSSNTFTLNYPKDLDDFAGLATTTGNTIVASSTGWKTLAVGSNGKVLTASSTASNGISWETVVASASPGGSNTQIQYNNNGTTAGDANFTWSSTTQSLAIGNAPNTFTNAIINASGTAASYLQFHIINNSAGATSTGEFVATANNGSDSLNFISFGVNSSGYNAPAWSGQEADSGFLYTSDRRLFIGSATSSANGGIVFFTGGQTSSTWRGIIDSAGKWGIGTTTTSEVLTVAGNIKLANSTSGIIFFDGGKLTGIPVTSTIAGTGITVNAATGTVTITNNGVTSITASSSIGITNATGTVNIGAKNYSYSGMFIYGTSTSYTKGTSTIQNKLITFDTTSTLRNIRVSVEGTSTANFVSFNLYSGTSTPSNLATTTGTFAAFTADQTVVNSTSTLLTPNASTTMCAGCFLRIFPYNASTTEFSITGYYDQN